jgi:pimeloyl-ACP methyl ester carboxylesterase
MQTTVERFESTDGIGIAYRQWNAAAGGLPVMLHHGFAADGALNWQGPGVVAALVEARRWVVAIDARGHGASDKPHDPARYGEAIMARDLMALVDRLSAERYDLVGYSMGAVVSLLVAAQDPRVRRLVVGGVGEGILVCGGVDTRALPNLTLAEALEAEDVASVKDPGAAGFRAFADMLRADRKALAAQARSVHAQPIALDRIKVPALVLAGDADPLAVRPELLARAIAGAELRALAGDHLGALQDPKFVESVRDFVRLG